MSWLLIYLLMLVPSLSVQKGCGGVISDVTGSITSPQLPDSYPYSRFCVWKIVADPHFHVTIVFTSFNLASATPSSTNTTEYCLSDEVIIYSETALGFTQHGAYCGTELPPYIKSTGTTLFVQYRSYSSNGNSGFSALFSSACGGVITDFSGTITSPGYPEHSYPTRCLWKIVAPPNRHVILNIEVLRDEYNDGIYGGLLIYSESVIGFKEHHINNELPRSIMSEGNTLLIQFYSTSSRQYKFSAYFLTGGECISTKSCTRGRVCVNNTCQEYTESEYSD